MAVCAFESARNRQEDAAQPLDACVEKIGGIAVERSIGTTSSVPALGRLIEPPRGSFESGGMLGQTAHSDRASGRRKLGYARLELAGHPAARTVSQAS